MVDVHVKRLWALSFVAIGFILMLSFKVSITGAAVGVSQFAFVGSSLMAFGLVLTGLIWFSSLR